MADQILLNEFWPIMVISARMIGLFSWMPGFGDLHIPFRMRMMIAVGVATAFALTLKVPSYPVNSFYMSAMLISEYLTGTFLGFTLKLFLSALETAGTIMSQSIGLSNALVPNLVDHDQTSILTSFFTLSGVTFIFVFDLHHLILWGVYNSYELIPIGTLNILQDKALLITHTVNDAFAYALKFSMPFFIFGNIIYIGMGILNKLIPQIQVFFLSMPIQILVGLIILMFSVGFILTSFLEYVSQAWTKLTG
ncbi:flagellar biosynthetic protein FliR [Candidatus Bodocaedibacter vickermanii]|uniref:Flagellar biosynthetic protein FliR n=1 Tax=Candidatus Bodocaedibacter vickermanii TaxID=2741701 RepID=A0A7L9RV31_9PROT|nr:flagellar biosynthetic protein FliR [Candidatus Paracaedibacteraceae bacterium 'Lake Konstanz']